MRRSVKENLEEIRVLSFQEVDPKDKDSIWNAEVNEMVLMVPFAASQFAISAMLKGYRDHFLTVTGENGDFDKDFLEKIDHNLKVFRDLLEKKKEKSSLILP